MCYDHSYEEPPWVAEFLATYDAKGYFLPERCFPGFGVHEHCEHTRAPVTFKGIAPAFDRV